MSEISMTGNSFVKENSIVVNGNFYDIGIPIIKWTDPGGFNAYDTSKVVHEDEDRATGKVKKVVVKGKRYGGKMRGGPQAVKQILQHHTGGFTASQCFKTLHEVRGISVQFINDDWGKVYQTLDAVEKAWHGGILCGSAIGIENVLFPDGSDTAAYSKKRRDKLGVNAHVIDKQYIQGSERDVYVMPKVQVDSLIILTAGIWAAVANEKGPLFLQEGHLPLFMRGFDGKILMDYSEYAKNHLGQVLHANSSKMKWDMVGVPDMEGFEAKVIKQYQMFVSKL